MIIMINKYIVGILASVGEEVVVYSGSMVLTKHLSWNGEIQGSVRLYGL